MKSISLYDLQKIIANRMEKRRKIGWFDYSSDSYDMRQAMARAVRVFFRVNRGVHLTLRECQGL